MIYAFKTHQIEMYDSIHDLPVLRFQRFNKYQMMASEIGNNFSDFDRRSQKVIDFLRKGMTDEALQELENRRQTVFNAFNEFSPTGKSLAILIKRIDNVKYDTFTPDDLDRCIAHLDRIDFDMKTSFEKLSEVKKKSKQNLQYIILNFFRKMGGKKKRHSELSVSMHS